MSNLLELQNVTKVFKGGTVTLDDISFHVNAESPSIIAVAGESGSGKTTLGLMSMGFLDPSEGQILYDGQDIHKMLRQQRFQFRHEVQAVFQDPCCCL